MNEKPSGQRVGAIAFRKEGLLIETVHGAVEGPCGARDLLEAVGFIQPNGGGQGTEYAYHTTRAGVRQGGQGKSAKLS